MANYSNIPEGFEVVEYGKQDSQVAAPPEGSPLAQQQSGLGLPSISDSSPKLSGIQKEIQQQTLKTDLKAIQQSDEEVETQNNILRAVDASRMALDKLEELPHWQQTGTFGNARRWLLKAYDTALPGEHYKDAINNLAIVQSTGQDLVSKFYSATKGAISNVEFEAFQSAGPNINETIGGNRLLLNLFEAGAERITERNSFLRKYLETNGNLNEAATQWKRFVDENKLFDADLKLNKENIASWDKYIDPNFSKEKEISEDYKRKLIKKYGTSNTEALDFIDKKRNDLKYSDLRKQAQAAIEIDKRDPKLVKERYKALTGEDFDAK